MVVSEDATITSKGQVTIPKQIRDDLGLEAGTELTFVVEESGEIRIQPKKPPLEQLRDIKQQLTAHDIDIKKMRQESKAAWSSHLGGKQQ